MSALFPAAAGWLLRVAAVGIGTGFACLFATWYVVFCRRRDMVSLAAAWPSLGGADSDCTAGAPGGTADPERRAVLFRFMACLLVVTCVVEVARNLLLGSTAITFYAGAINLGCLCLKVAGAVWLLRVFDSRDVGSVSVAFRLAFLLLLGVVLCMPMLLQGDWFAHTLLDASSFFYQLVVLIVAYQIVEAFGMGALAVFCCARLMWAIASLAGIGIHGLMGASGPEFMQQAAVAMGLMLASWPWPLSLPPAPRLPGLPSLRQPRCARSCRCSRCPPVARGPMTSPTV